jgi:hypothetical protein
MMNRIVILLLIIVTGACYSEALKRKKLVAESVANGVFKFGKIEDNK